MRAEEIEHLGHRRKGGVERRRDGPVRRPARPAAPARTRLPQPVVEGLPQGVLDSLQRRDQVAVACPGLPAGQLVDVGVELDRPQRLLPVGHLQLHGHDAHDRRLLLQPGRRSGRETFLAGVLQADHERRRSSRLADVTHVADHERQHMAGFEEGPPQAEELHREPAEASGGGGLAPRRGIDLRRALADEVQPVGKRAVGRGRHDALQLAPREPVRVLLDPRGRAGRHPFAEHQRVVMEFLEFPLLPGPAFGLAPGAVGRHLRGPLRLAAALVLGFPAPLHPLGGAPDLGRLLGPLASFPFQQPGHMPFPGRFAGAGVEPSPARRGPLPGLLVVQPFPSRHVVPPLSGGSIFNGAAKGEGTDARGAVRCRPAQRPGVPGHFRRRLYGTPPATRAGRCRGGGPGKMPGQTATRPPE